MPKKPEQFLNKNFAHENKNKSSVHSKSESNNPVFHQHVSQKSLSQNNQNENSSGSFIPLTVMPSPSISNEYTNQFIGFYNNNNENDNNNNNLLFMDHQNYNNEYLAHSFKSSQMRSVGVQQYYNINYQNNNFQTNLRPLITHNHNNNNNNIDAPLFAQPNFFQYPQDVNNFQPIMRNMNNININYTNPELLVVIPFNLNVFNSNNSNNFSLM